MQWDRGQVACAPEQPLAPATQDEPVVMSGYLHKLKRNPSTFTSSWNQRWFTIQGTKFRYYSTKTSTISSDSISLISITAIKRFPVDKGTYR
jgi:hypothetical protein